MNPSQTFLFQGIVYTTRLFADNREVKILNLYANGYW